MDPKIGDKVQRFGHFTTEYTIEAIEMARSEFTGALQRIARLRAADGKTCTAPLTALVVL